MKSLSVCLFLACSSSAAAWAADSIEPQHLQNIRQVTSGLTKAGEGYFSPDAQTIIYQGVPQGYPFYQIYTQPAAGGPPRLVSTGRGRTTCAFFRPDGRKIIFASSHLDPQLDATEEAERKQQAEDAAAGRRRRYQWDFDPHMEIFQADPDGGNLERLTSSPGYDAECSFSPDGRQIVFSSDRDGDPDLYVMNADGSNVRQLTNAPGYDGGPFFSPDGKWIVFRSDRKQPEFLQLYVIAADGRHETALTDTVGVNWAPYWHPTQPYIVWTGADHSNPQARPNYDLWLMRYELAPADGGGQRIVPGPITRLTDHLAADVLPVFSPDGRKLMWTSNRTDDHSSQLFLADFRLPE
jgi:Tol biopolymer transport system component